jgi:KinB signaling pathway activation protein
MAKPLRWYLKLLAVLTIVSCVAQLAFPAELGAVSGWGVARGWQREIAFWNLAMYVLIARTLRANDAVAAMHDRARLNAMMCAVNYGCVAFGAFALRTPGAATRD